MNAVQQPSFTVCDRSSCVNCRKCAERLYDDVYTNFSIGKKCFSRSLLNSLLAKLFNEVCVIFVYNRLGLCVGYKIFDNTSAV